MEPRLDEGSFVATYKYALLHAIADPCIVRGDDSGDELRLETREIAERFIELYWRQALPFPAGERSKVLAQNTGRQAAVASAVQPEEREGGPAFRDHVLQFARSREMRIRRRVCRQ